MEPSYRWIPGFGPDLAALDVLIQAGPPPPHPFREYSLDGQERGVYTELLEHGIDAVRTPDLMRYFDRVAKLIEFHGHLAEKDRWFHYLFAELIRRILRIDSEACTPHPIENWSNKRYDAFGFQDGYDLRRSEASEAVRRADPPKRKVTGEDVIHTAFHGEGEHVEIRSVEEWQQGKSARR